MLSEIRLDLSGRRVAGFVRHFGFRNVLLDRDEAVRRDRNAIYAA